MFASLTPHKDHLEKAASSQKDKVCSSIQENNIYLEFTKINSYSSSKDKTKKMNR